MRVRTIFEVCAESDGSWCVGPEGGKHVRYVSYDEALGAAIAAAQECWERYQVPTGVRVHDTNGNLKDERSFGEVQAFPD